MNYKRILPYLFFISTFILYGQNKIEKDTVYYDENKIEISKDKFIDKCNAAVFYCKQFDIDNYIVYKVYHRMYFGKLTPQEYNQIRMYLNQQSIKNTPKNHSILIHYEENLAGFKESNEYCNLINSYSLEENYNYFNLNAKKNNEEPIKSIKAFKQIVEWHRKEFHNLKKFNKDVANYAKQQNKCIRKVELRFKTPVYYAIYNNNNYPLKNDYFTWLEVNSIIKTTFTKNHPDIDLIILKPNGEYFIKNDFLPNSVLFKLLKEKDWTKFKNDWNQSIKTNYNLGYGIIFDTTKDYDYYIPSCY
ncbi:hypothetical protein [Urechidicola croceus]|nr:hypothetical protein [Urechidicola croceus]